VSGSAASSRSFLPAGEVAAAFVAARREARALPAYPGPLPATLADGYAVQDAALALWGERPVGWKVGRVPPELQGRLGEQRVAGPVFARNLWRASPGRTLDFPVFEGGFAAVEGEFVYRMAVDAPAGRTQWTADDALALVSGLHIGVETAGSPLATINALGSTVVASDFGNNWGLIVGPEVSGWRELAFADMPCETFIDGKSVGAGTAASLPDGPAEALAWLLGHAAARGLPLKAGDLVTTGAVTGVHDITAGQQSRVSFGRFGEILCRAVPARALGPGEEGNVHEHDDAG
jgi:2-keto-4-pentenoate hydratase